MPVPIGLGESLTSFLNSYLRFSGEERARRQAEQLAQIRELQLAEARRRTAAEEALPENLAALASAAPEVRVAAPAEPPRLLAPLKEGEDPEAAAMLPRTYETKPEAVVQGHTLGSVSQQIGPQRLAQLMATPEGQAAIRAKGLISDEELARRERLARSRRAFERFSQEAMASLEQGDAVGHMLKSYHAWQQLAEAADTPEQAQQAYQRAQSYREKAAELIRDKEERRLADLDAERIGAAAKRAASEPGSPDAILGLFQAYSSVQSKWGREQRDKYMAKVAEKGIAGIDKGPTQEFWRDYAAIMSGASGAGDIRQPMVEGEGQPAGVETGKMTPEAAIKAVFYRKPWLIAPVMQDALAKGPMSDLFYRALTGREKLPDADKDFLVAMHFTRTIDGLDPMSTDKAEATRAAVALKRNYLSILSAKARARAESREDPGADIRAAATLTARQIDSINRQIQALEKQLSDPYISVAGGERKRQIEAELEEAKRTRDALLSYSSELHRILTGKSPLIPQKQDATPARSESRVKQIIEGLKRDPGWSTLTPEQKKQAILNELKRRGINIETTR